MIRTMRGTTKHSLMRPSLHYVCMIVLANVMSGCSLISIKDVPSPFPENLPFGQILQEIRIEGNVHTKTWIVESAMASQVGEPYTEENSRSDYLWLGTLGVFTAINFDTEPVADGIALIVRVSEATQYIPSFSFRINEENGIEIGPAIVSPNLFGAAIRASAYARFGGSTNYGLRYLDPKPPRSGRECADMCKQPPAGVGWDSQGPLDHGPMSPPNSGS